MTLRTVVRDGLIIINTHGSIPDGTPVEVVPRTVTPEKKAATTVKRVKTTGATKRKPRGEAGPLSGFGMWKDREDWRGKSARQIAAELRRKAMGDRYRG